MRLVRPALVFVVAGLLATNLFAGSLTLGDLSTQADKIVRGEVVAVNEGSVVNGGTAVPTITYLIRVDEVFKGDVQTVKGVQVLELQSATLKRLPGGGFVDLPRMPALTLGESYVLFTSAPVNGLTTTVGLQQGTFHIDRGTSTQLTSNQFKSDLFSASVDAPFAGAVPYAEFANQIRAELGQ